ncbi:MAG TPA: sulfotransferase [Anaerolineae bacterium]|nr:sulfotransferase [Anaerolineae bacterium]
MKTLCLLTNSWDAEWIGAYWNNKSRLENVTVVASSFEGRIIAQQLGVPHNSYEELAWSLKKPELFYISRKKASQWHQMPKLKDIPQLEAVRYFKEYPLLWMHYYPLSQALYEMLQSYQFMGKILEIEQPDKILLGKQTDPFAPIAIPPFNMQVLNILTQSNGLEREALKVLANNKNIKVVEMPTQAPSTFARLQLEKNKKLYTSSPSKSGLPTQNVLIFTWAGNYLKQLSDMLDQLCQLDIQVNLVIVGDRLSPDQEQNFTAKNINYYYKTDFSIPDEQTIFDEWRAKGEKAYASIRDNADLKDYFSGEHGSYFNGLVDQILYCDFVNNIPFTVIELLRSETIVNTLKPDVVLTNFAHHPWENADVLPARNLGIPTLYVGHGITGYLSAVRDAASTQYYGVLGEYFKDALMEVFNWSEDELALIGHPQLDHQLPLPDKRHSKIRFRLNPDQPVCIFCDMSEFMQAFEQRHSTYTTLHEIVKLKTHIPNLQIVYRTHHGVSSAVKIREYLSSLNLPGVHFQTSPNPPLMEIAQAADLVISHYTSAVTEALIIGVPVIYLTALASEVEPSFMNCEAIKIANEFEALPDLVKSIIQASLSRQEIRAMAQPYFDRALCGIDGKSNTRLANLILSLAQKTEHQKRTGFQDWIDRIKTAGETKVVKPQIVATNSNMKPKANCSKRNPAQQYLGNNLVFIVGCPRSGTTWLQRLLSSHPKIHTGQESDLFDMFVGPQLKSWNYLMNHELSGRPVGLPCYFKEQEYIDILKEYMLALLQPMIGPLHEGEFFLEKTPSHALYLPEIHKLLPESKIIHLVRDVRDVVASLLAASKSWGKHWAPKDAQSAAQMWVNHVQAVRLTSKTLPKSHFCELKYEDLSADPAKVLANLFNFLGLAWNKEIIAQAIEANRLQIAAKTGGSTIPVGGQLSRLLGAVTQEPEGFVRKGRPGAWVEDLPKEDIVIIGQIARTTMETIGYPWEVGGDTTKGNNWYIARRNDSEKNASIDSVVEKLRNESDIEKVIFNLEQQLEDYPDAIELLTLKAETKILKGELYTAKQILIGVILRSPEYLSTLNCLGVIEFLEGNPNSAKEFFKNASIIDPSYKPAVLNLDYIQNKDERQVSNQKSVKFGFINSGILLTNQ